MEELALAQRRTADLVAGLTEAVKTLVGHVDQLRGWSLEYRSQRHAPAYLRRLLRGVHAASSEEVAKLVEEAEEKGLLTSAEAEDVLRADLVCTGRLQKDRQQRVRANVEVSRFHVQGAHHHPWSAHRA